MAARFCDSFDAYATADLLLRWTNDAVASGATIAISAGNGRNGTSSLRITPNGNGFTHIYKLLDSQATWIVGFAFRTSNTSVNGWPIFSLMDSNNIQIDLRYNAAPQLYVTRNGTTLGVSGTALPVNTYVYIEVQATINGTTGSITVRQNGTAVITLTNVNTQATGNASANQIDLGQNGNNQSPFSSNWDYDDLYVLDGTGAAPLNTFLGDSRVQAVHPNGAGASTQFTLGAGTSNWEAVSETTEDGDTTYVSSATAGQIDLYTFPAIAATSGSVAFVQSMLVARKDDAGVRTIQPIVRQGVTNTLVGVQHNLGTQYQQWLDIQATDPTGATWTIANLNADQFGQEEIA